LREWNGQVGPISPGPEQPLLRLPVVLGIAEDVAEVDGPAVEDRTSHGVAPHRRPREQAAEGIHLIRGHVVQRDEVENGAVEACHRAGVGLAKSRRTLDDGIEHRLGVRGRRRDEPEDLGCGRLLREGFGQARFH
jgi:hypothetical protein